MLSAFALFHFLFLGVEYLFDNMMAFVTTPDGVVMAQSYLLGANVLGFLLYPAAGIWQSWLEFHTRQGYCYSF